LFFGSFSSDRAADALRYSRDVLLLHPGIAAVNTIILLTSSLLVALGIYAARENSVATARRYLFGAIILGFAFLVVKAAEYGLEIQAGITPVYSPFFMYYFAVTGIHFLHVAGGLGVLLFVRARLRLGENGRTENLALAESGGVFWHMVDLLWLVIFPLFYLLI